MTKPYALLRAGYPFFTTLGMRRVTTYPTDLVVGNDRDIYTLNRTDGAGGQIRRTNWDDEDLGDIGSGFIWPVQMIAGPDDSLVVSDEGNHTISFWSKDGVKLNSWGVHGSGVGEMNRPSGIAFDSDGNLLVVDSVNHRIQKFTVDGTFVSVFGEKGDGDGQFNMPWGVAIDPNDGAIVVGDWRNNRVQKFSANGEYLMQFGSTGSGRGEMNRPAGVTVDEHSDIYVADRGNHRVQLFNSDGEFVDVFLGDAVLSKSGRTYIMANPKVLRSREDTDLVDVKRLRGVMSVRVYGDLMYIPDFGCHRIQVYRKEAYELSSDQIYARPTAPTLYTV
ncbi:MAG: SMP-30/gluconolactonase/LRE family protein [Chloroflexi bacterium]|nr:SMP-30/gluconolactonase/LRE family protein [Chloroflexota bacterium]